LAETNLAEELSPFTLSVQVFFLMNYLAGAMGMNENTFHIGKKITKTSAAAK
jgi:hypothetical protein